MTSQLEATGAGVGEATARRLDRMQQDDVVRRIWSADHTVWKPGPDEIADRLGWLTVLEPMTEQLPGLRAFAAEVQAEGYETAVLLGMGGSSLGPEVLASTFGAASDGLRLLVLDSTDPAAVRGVEQQLELERTLFIVASKSGSTVETLSHFAYFWNRLPDGAHFIAITDPASSLERIARDHGFRRVFLNPPDIGGRYSVLSYFGLVPAALIGVDLDRLMRHAQELQQACHWRAPAGENLGARLGAALGEAALAGRDQLTLVLPPERSAFGYWVEQLIAESTGKEGRGILPVEGEPLGPPEVYGDRRLFVSVGEHAGLDALERAGHPVVRLPYANPFWLGAEFFRWEFATAVAGHVLGINPFDQPNVQEAKDATARILREPPGREVPALSIEQLLRSVEPGDYLAILAYLPRIPDIDATLQAARVRLRDRFRVATTVGYGPRYLHSTGQLHKGGPGNGAFIQVVGDDADDIAIPGQPYTFGQLKRAQAQGDLASLRAHDRRVARASLAQLLGL